MYDVRRTLFYKWNALNSMIINMDRIIYVLCFIQNTASCNYRIIDSYPYLAIGCELIDHSEGVRVP